MEKKTTTNYKIVVEVLGRKWKQEGKTVEETLAKFTLGWEQIKGKGILTISRGSKKHTHLMPAHLLRRIFNNKITRGIWAKNLTLLVKSDNKTNIPERLDIEKKVD